MARIVAADFFRLAPKGRHGVLVTIMIMMMVFAVGPMNMFGGESRFGSRHNLKTYLTIVRKRDADDSI